MGIFKTRIKIGNNIADTLLPFLWEREGKKAKNYFFASLRNLLINGDSFTGVEHGIKDSQINHLLSCLDHISS